MKKCLGLGVAQWLRRCATGQKVLGSILGGVTGFFSYILPSDCTMALGSTQPLVKTSTRNISGGKGGRYVRLTTSPPSCAEFHEIWEPKPPGTLWATLGLLRGSFTFYEETFIFLNETNVQILYIDFCSVLLHVSAVYFSRCQVVVSTALSLQS